jgi:hypothetical protein
MRGVWTAWTPPPPAVTRRGHARQWMIPMAPEPDSRLDVVAPSWRGAVLGAGDTCCWSDRPLRRHPGEHSTNNPTFVGNRYRRYPHVARDAVADTHAPGPARSRAGRSRPSSRTVRESTESQREALLDLKRRGVEAPALAIATLGFWGTLREGFPTPASNVASCTRDLTC